MWWLVLDRPNVDLCLRDEGFEVDLVVGTGLLSLTQVYPGRLPITQAMREGVVAVEGPRDLRRAFPQWVGVGSFASYGGPRAAVAASRSP